MKINIDPVISSRIKQAWAALAPDQRNRIAPLLAKAHQQAVTFSQTQVAPPADPAVRHQLLLAHSAITNDQDAVLDKVEAGVVVDVAPGGEIWGTGKYQQLDPGWAEAAAVWLEHLILGKHAFNNTPPTIPIPDAVQIAMAGDWGTGDWRTAGNPAPSTDVRNHIAFLQPDLTIHLGDVYYAGTNDQEQHLLVNLWPPGTLGALALNSNHEMYPGADAYFEEALRSDLFQVQQQCSFFALENSDWVIVGLDSAYYSDAEGLYMDGSLHPDGGPTVQLDFLKAQVAKGKQVIVLTHHNGLSEDGSSTTKLWSQVMSAFPTGGPAYWYWGHVHAGVAYKPQGAANVLCRCNGHAALPWGQASQLDGNPNVEWYEKRSANDPDIAERVLNGFAVLYLNGQQLDEVFYDENGGVAWP
jgi:calcineurin-like phosphoesterase family protein